MARDTNPIILDDRERPSGLHEAIHEVCGIKPVIERLPTGDILVHARYLIERKSAADFVASIIDGRLMNQSARLRGDGFEPVMIVEGEFTEAICRGLSRAALRGAMLSVALDWAIPILRAKSIEDTAHWIAALLGRNDDLRAPPDWRSVTPTGARRPAGPRRPRQRIRSPAADRRAQSLALIREIQGVGEAKARTLLGQFGSVASLVQASPAQIAALPGFGPRLARQILQTLHGRDD